MGKIKIGQNRSYSNLHLLISNLVYIHNIPIVLRQKGLSDISSFLQERQKRDFKQLSFPLLFGK